MRFTALFVCLLAGTAIAAPRAGQKIYASRCGSCHDAPDGRTPSRAQLASRSSADLVRAMTRGLMRVQAAGLTAQQRRDVAAFLVSSKPATKSAPAAQAKPQTTTTTCAAAAPMRIDANAWNGWGRDVENSRYQPAPGLAAADVPRLCVKWAFAMPGRGVRGQPAVAGGRVFVASNEGHVYALDAKSGCTLWTYAAAGASARTAISAGALPGGGFAVYFGDDKGGVHAVDAATGAALWKVKADDFRGAMITGAPTLYRDRLYVPVSSNEEMVAGFSAAYECCKFRGSIVALDAATGRQLWKSYVIAEEPKAFRRASGKQGWGPAGAAVWSAPTIDAKRNLLYAGTGNSYTDVATKTADAIVAFDLDSGAMRWSRQQTEHDNYILNCKKGGNANCPDVAGEDYDFGSSPILHTLPDGRQVILAGQKSGILYALDPDRDGELLWKVRLSPGSYVGGIQWGSAADGERVYVAISDAVAERGAAPGLHAIDAADGRVQWSTPAPAPPCSWGTLGCSHAQSGAVTAIPGIAFSGALDGHLRAYATGDGAIVWDFDTARSYDTVNGLAGSGGSLDTGGAAIVDGMLYINSGYALLAGHVGNVLLAFSIDGK